MGFDEFNPYASCPDYVNCLLTTTTTVAHDILTGSFTITNRPESLSILSVGLGGYGTDDFVFVNETKTFSVSGNINTPNAAIFTITTPLGIDPVNITFDSLTCTGVLDVQVVGGATAIVNIIITPINYDGSYDVISGNLTIIAS
jgi:hypothetical protein